MKKKYILRKEKIILNDKDFPSLGSNSLSSTINYSSSLYLEKANTQVPTQEPKHDIIIQEPEPEPENSDLDYDKAMMYFDFLDRYKQYEIDRVGEDEYYKVHPPYIPEYSDEDDSIIVENDYEEYDYDA